MMVLSSRIIPGAFPTLCSGTNKVETFVLTVCTNDVVETLFSLASVGRFPFAPQPPNVTRLRKDWADVRRPRRLYCSERDLGGTG